MADTAKSHPGLDHHGLLDVDVMSSIPESPRIHFFKFQAARELPDPVRGGAPGRSNRLSLAAHVDAQPACREPQGGQGIGARVSRNG
eukprot:15437570-Alexandrium_andersonii.AAC.1